MIPEPSPDYSVVIPAHNEEGCIENTLRLLLKRLDQEPLRTEIVVFLDHCSDGTADVVARISAEDDRVRSVVNPLEGGFGMAVRCGLDNFSGKAVTIFMADASDSPDDLCTYFRLIDKGAECVFGSRFVKGGGVHDYPPHKLILNRLANLFVRILFGHGLNDTTNAFKCYRREVIQGCQPLLSKHFNLTVELPLKAIIRGYNFQIVPISWHNRTSGVSKLKIREMGSRYLFIVLYCFLERLLSRGDYRRMSDGQQTN
jgi:dolichol-phosphate mannosyltransferase